MSQDDHIVLGEIFKQQHKKDHPLLAANDYFEIFASEQILKARGYDLDSDQIASGIEAAATTAVSTLSIYS